MNKATVLFYRGRTGLIPMRLPATTTAAGVLGLDFAICMPAQHARLVYWNIFQETLSDTTVLLGCGFEVSGNHLEDIMRVIRGFCVLIDFQSSQVTDSTW